MNATVSRRQFLQRAGSLAIGTTALALIGNGQTVKQAMATPDLAQNAAQTIATDGIELWLLNTGQGDIDAEIYTLLTAETPVNHKIFLPAIQQR